MYTLEMRESRRRYTITTKGGGDGGRGKDNITI